MGLNERRKLKDLQQTTFPGRVKEIEEICGAPIPYEVDWESLADDAGALNFIDNIACHRLKVLIALEDELRAAPDAAWAETACAAVNRYLHTPMKRHHGLRIAAQALDFVAREA